MISKLKLVRHFIPNLYPEGKMRYERGFFGDHDHQRFMRKKLVEEVEEYLEDRTVEELVDVIEAACATAWVCHGVDSDELSKLADRKRQTRGSFYDPVMMIIEDPTTSWMR